MKADVKAANALCAAARFSVLFWLDSAIHRSIWRRGRMRRKSLKPGGDRSWWRCMRRWF